MWSSGVCGYGWREQIDSIAEGLIQLLKDDLNKVESVVNTEWNVAHNRVGFFD